MPRDAHRREDNLRSTRQNNNAPHNHNSLTRYYFIRQGAKWLPGDLTAISDCEKRMTTGPLDRSQYKSFVVEYAFPAQTQI